MNKDDSNSKQIVAHDSSGQQENREAIQPAAPARALVVAPRRQSAPPGRRRTFPLRLHALLSDVETTGQTDIISWQPHGRCFVVHKTDEFVEKLLPQYFNQTKWSSFQRQLNLYSFERISAGVDRGGYYHRYFLRGEPALCNSIPRTKVKGTKFRVPSDVRKQPNFYLQQPVNPPAAPSLTGLGFSGLDHLLNPPFAMQMAHASPNLAYLANPNNLALLQSMVMANPHLLAAINPHGLQMSQTGMPFNAATSAPASNVGHAGQHDTMNPSSAGTTAAPAAPTAHPAAILPAPTELNATTISSERIDQMLASFSPSGVARWPDLSSFETSSVPRNEQAISEGTTTNDSSNETEAEDDYRDSKPAAVEKTNQLDDGDVTALLQLAGTSNVGAGTVGVSPAEATVTQSNLPTEGNTSSASDAGGPASPSSGGDHLDESSEWGKFLNRYFD